LARISIKIGSKGPEQLHDELTATFRHGAAVVVLEQHALDALVRCWITLERWVDGRATIAQLHEVIELVKGPVWFCPVAGCPRRVETAGIGPAAQCPQEDGWCDPECPNRSEWAPGPPDGEG
jgi:hypothetical protein